jgi:hypothetical protein
MHRGIGSSPETKRHGLKRIRDFLDQPYPYEYDLKTIFRESAGIGFFIFLFLQLFRPFEAGADQSSACGRLLANLGFGAISFLIGFAYDAGIPRLFPKPFLTGNARVRHIFPYVVGILFCIGLGNAFYFRALSPGGSLLDAILVFQFYTVAVGAIPVVFILLLQQFMHLRQHVRNAEAINRELDGAAGSGPAAPADGQPLVLTSENGKETVRLPAAGLLFVKSAGNYVEVYAAEPDGISTHLMRNTIKRVEQALTANPMIVRCHRAYLINLAHVRKVVGDSQGVLVSVGDAGIQVPVSRGYLKPFKRHIDRMTAR